MIDRGVLSSFAAFFATFFAVVDYCYEVELKLRRDTSSLCVKVYFGALTMLCDVPALRSSERGEEVEMAGVEPASR